MDKLIEGFIFIQTYLWILIFFIEKKITKSLFKDGNGNLFFFNNFKKFCD